MLYLILLGLAASLVLLLRRYWALRRGVRLLAEALAQRKAFLNDEDDLPRLHGSWRSLVDSCATLVQEVNRLKHQRAGHLTQLETTLGNLQEAVLIVDNTNTILLANRALRTIFPGSREILGQRLETVLHSSVFLSYLQQVRSGSAQPRSEIEFIESGKSVWIEATGSLIPETSDQSGAWTLFVLHDVTRQKHLENLRREFVANVSHELKTPLSVIKGYAETLADDHASMARDDREKFIRTIYRHAERLSTIVDDLLTLSRLESSMPGLRRAPHELRAFIQTTADEFRSRLGASGHHLALVGGGDELQVDMDSFRITQVLANLLDNAQKYTPAGCRIEIGAAATEDGTEIHVWVADDGPGIPAADLPRIFERFFRVEKGRSREKGGTGLGLSIVKHIVQLHGGRVWAESEVGKGTRIAFSLPRGAGDKPGVSVASAYAETPVGPGAGV